MRIASCMVCGEGFEYASFGEAEHTMGGDCVGVCPTCRKHAEIGRRIGRRMDKMNPAKALYHYLSEYDKGLIDGWNDCLSEAKGPNK